MICNVKGRGRQAAVVVDTAAGQSGPVLIPLSILYVVVVVVGQVKWHNYNRHIAIISALLLLLHSILGRCRIEAINVRT